MPITLDDDLALMLLRQLTRVPPTSGAIIQQMLVDQQKLLLQLSNKVDQMSQTTQTTDQAFQTEIAGMRDDMAKQTTVTNSVLVFVTGLGKKLADAMASAQAAGATADELAAVKALHADLTANTAALATATTDNTVAATEPPVAVTPTTTVPAAAVSAAASPDEGTAAAG